MLGSGQCVLKYRIKKANTALWHTSQVCCILWHMSFSPSSESHFSCLNSKTSYSCRTLLALTGSGPNKNWPGSSSSPLRALIKSVCASGATMSMFIYMGVMSGQVGVKLVDLLCYSAHSLLGVVGDTVEPHPNFPLVGLQCYHQLITLYITNRCYSVF